MTDLHRLSNQGQGLRTNEQSISAVPPPKRRWVSRVAVPLAIVLATLALILYAARDVVIPATMVTTTRAVAVEVSRGSSGDAPDSASATHTAPSSVVAQAPGWVEPDPYPVYASALADGVVKRVHVLEGEAVEAGQLLVELIDDDAKLALSEAKAQLAQAEAKLAAAETDLEEPIALRRAEAVTKSQVDAKQAALTRLDAEVAKEQARLDELVAAYERLAGLGKQSVSALNVEEAKYRVQSQRAAVEATRQRRPMLDAELATAKADHAAAKRNLELKTQLKRTRDEAAASRDEAEVKLRQAELRLQRMTIISPTSGVVMARLVGPGSKVMLGMESSHSAHTIHLYDPQKLQVRVDVPLADAAKVGLGQRAEIVVDVLPDHVFSGEVTRLVHQADIAKNTVQFKVAIAAPSPLLKPDMLARVKFFSGQGSTTSKHVSKNSAPGSLVAIKQTAVVKQDEQAFVWWISPLNQRIEKRAVTIGNTRDDGTTLIASGLNPGDLVVDQPAADLQPDQRVRSHNSAHEVK